MSSNKNSIRGLTAGTTRRDGFLPSSTFSNGTSTFDIGRVEVVRGPSGGTLFGASGAGGSVNTVSKQARFRNTSGSLMYRIDQFGSEYALLDGNVGTDRLAARVALLSDNTKYRRLNLGSQTEGAYVQIAAHLPHNTLLRVSGRRTHSDRLLPTNTADLNFTNATRDPRHLYSLAYLLATGQAGATNPATGAAYPGGAVANGLLDWYNQQSWSGWAQAEDIDTDLATATLDTVWTPWLSTSFGAMYNTSKSQRGPDGGTLLAPRTFNTANPLDTWANSSTFRMDGVVRRAAAYRAAALLTNSLFSGRARSQTSFGFDLDSAAAGTSNYRYYLADASGNITYSPGAAGADALGRTAMPTLYWSVNDGPVKKPYFRIGSRQVNVGGQNYALTLQNPRRPEWVSPLNPLGLATLAVSPAIAGVNKSDYDDEDGTYGYYITNYTSWFNDRFATLLGWRITTRTSRRGNISATGTSAWTDTDKTNGSYNAGVSYTLRPGVNAFYNFARSFEPDNGANDPLGNAPKAVQGSGDEIGLKVATRDSRLTGSVQYYRAKSKGEQFNYPGSVRDLVNPLGLNGAFIGPGGERSTWVVLDKESSGLEVILTANPTRNWRIRFAATSEDGKILNELRYPILWNDDFYRTSAGVVTYRNGDPFLVPVDAAGVTAVSRLTSESAPVTGTTQQPLTIAMLSDRNNDYYAYGKGSEETANGAIRTNSVVYRALRWFNKPVGGQPNTAFTGKTGLPVSAIPYKFSDPVGYGPTALVAAKGEPTIGHSLYRFNLTNNFDFREGWLRGFGVGGSVNWAVNNRTYYYTEPDGKGGNLRFLFKAPVVSPQVNGNLQYQRKFGRYTWRTQVNVNNLFNHYVIGLTPSGTTGYTVGNAIGATFYGQPRQYIWTNTISF
jgi:outer membrane receptor protein involved in Fe transport